MNRYLTICMTLALLVAAFLSGCSLSPKSPASPDEATASLPQSEIGQPQTTAPGVEPDREARTTTPTCAPLAEEETMTPEATPQATEAALPAGAAEVVQLAKDDLARRLDLPPEAIEVVSVKEVGWPDTSLGCPEPGMMYTQVITPGFLIVLEAEGQKCEYHTDRAQTAVLCDKGAMPGNPADGNMRIRVWEGEGCPIYPLTTPQPDGTHEGKPRGPIE